MNIKEKKSYNTEQRRLILSYLKKNCFRPVTAAELVRETGGMSISRSTLYRQLEQLSDEHIIIRSIQEKGRKYTYQLAQCDCGEHYHLKCASCGKMIHLDKATSELMQSKLLENNFDIDERSTVLIGKCSECKKNESESN